MPGPDRYKVERMLLKNVKYLSGIVLLIAVMLAATGCTSKAGSEDVKTTINQTLVGHNLTYFSIAGKPLNHTITSEDIGSIDPVIYKGNSAWKVHVGTSLAWNLTMSADGTEILDKEQLFRT